MLLISESDETHQPSVQADSDRNESTQCGERSRHLTLESCWNESELLKDYIMVRLFNDTLHDELVASLQDRHADFTINDRTRTVIEETINSYRAKPSDSFSPRSRDEAEQAHAVWSENRTLSALMHEDWDAFPYSNSVAELLAAVYEVEPAFALSQLERLDHPSIVYLTLGAVLRDRDKQVVALSSAPPLHIDPPDGKLAMTLIVAFDLSVERALHDAERLLFSSRAESRPDKGELADSALDSLTSHINEIFRRPDWHTSGPVIAIWLAQRIVTRSKDNAEKDLLLLFWIGVLQEIIERLVGRGLQLSTYNEIGAKSGFASPSDYPTRLSSLLCIAIHCEHCDDDDIYQEGMEFFTDVMLEHAHSDYYIFSSFLEPGYVAQRIGLLVERTNSILSIIKIMDKRLEAQLLRAEFKSDCTLLLRVQAAILRASISGLQWLLDYGDSEDEASNLWDSICLMAQKYWKTYYDVDVENIIRKSLLETVVHYAILPEDRPLDKLSRVLKGIGFDAVFLSDIAINLLANSVPVGEIDRAFTDAEYDLQEILTIEPEVALITHPSRENPQEVVRALLEEVLEHRAQVE